MGKVIAMPIKEIKPPVRNPFVATQNLIQGYSEYNRGTWQEDYLISYFGIVYTIPGSDYLENRDQYDVDPSTLLCPLGDEWTPLEGAIIEKVEITDLQTGDVIVMLRIPFRNMKVNRRGEKYGKY